jgi:hypothetical protein
MGIYTSLEDKWYDLVDTVDRLIPVGGVVDKVDSIVPSFVLFLLVIIAIILFLGWSVFGGIQPMYTAEITVLTQSNIPLKNADVLIITGCGTELTLSTDATGKVNVDVCETDIDVSVQKTGYINLGKTVSLNNGKATLRLSLLPTPNKEIYIEIRDTEEDLILGANVDLVCGNDVTTFENQTTNGFTIEIPDSCLARLKARADGYIEKNVSISTEERKTIHLEKLNLDGEVLFIAETSEGSESGVEINITSPAEENLQYFTNVFGKTPTIKLDEGNYSYIATSQQGEDVEGTFQISSGGSEEVNLFFETAPGDNTPSNIRVLALELVDGLDAPVIGARARLFKNDDYYGEKRSGTTGKTTGKKVKIDTLEENTTFSAVVKAVGYETKIVDLILQEEGSYQKVTMSLGGSKLSLKVVNDIGNPEESAFVSLTLSGFPEKIDDGYTDKNGELVLQNLPGGNYTIKAFDEQKKDEVEESFSLGSNVDLEKTIVLITGEGKLRFVLLGTNGGAKRATFDVYKTNGADEKLSSEVNKNFYRSSSLKKGSDLTLKTKDGNLFYHETINYEVLRGSQDKEVFLRDLADIPNSNEVQMFIMKVYSGNPVYGNVSRTNTTKLLENKKYWFYIDWVLNSEISDFALANIYIQNTGENKATIENIYSLDNALVLLSDEINDTIIDEQEDSIVEEEALQGNLVFDSVAGRRSIPLLVEINIDSNVEDFELFFEGMHGEYKSFTYSQQFVMGETFCTTDCPVFAFDNFLIVEGVTKPIGENNGRIYSDDMNTYLKTIVQNLSDKDIGTSTLNFSVPKNKQRYLLLETDKNSVSKSINIIPFSPSEERTIKLVPKKVGLAQIIENASQGTSGQNILDGYEGNNNVFSLEIARRIELEIGTAPNEIDSGRIYPAFLVKTNHKGRYRGVSMHWYAELVRDDSIVGRIVSGTTDENGLQTISLDTTSFEKNDILRFTSYDENGSIPGVLDVQIIEPFEVIEEEHECLSVNLAGVPIEQSFWVDKSIGDVTTITINSTCDDASRVYAHSDLPLSKKFVDIPSNGSASITATATPREGLLGAYPVQIVSITGERYHELGLVDIVINDPTNCFQISKGVFDFRENDNAQSAIITNTCFSGRKDNFYPQMNLQTNSVSIAYNKPGVPEIFSFTAKVLGRGVESIVYGFVKSDAMYVSETGGQDEDPWDTPLLPEEAKDTETVQDICEDMVYQGEYTPKPEPDIVPDDPVIPDTYDPSDLIDNDGDSDDLTADTGGDINDDADLKGKEKAKRASFNETPSDIYADSSTDVAGVDPSTDTDRAAGDTGELGGGDIPDYYTEGGEGTDYLGRGTPTLNGGPYHPGGYYMEYYWDVMHDIYGNMAMAAPRPPACSTDGDWLGVKEVNGGTYEILDVHQDDSARLVQATYAGGGEMFMRYYVAGQTEREWYQAVDWKTSYIQTQVDFTRVVEWLRAREAIWTEDYNIINPVEGKDYRVGRYSASPTPCWTREDTIGKYEPGESWNPNGSYSLVTAGCVTPNGLVDPERTAGAEAEFLWEINPASEPHTEYDGSGKIMYVIPTDSIPEELDVRLESGEYVAEYIGTPEISSPDINFTLTTNNLQGREYAILEVGDWVNGSDKKKQSFQIKLIGNPSQCFSVDGTEGMTGREFVPKLLFDWDWENIDSRQCDTTNNNYTYCDAAQFTTSLFKRLGEIDTLLVNDRRPEIATKTAYYAYLIADNYSDRFLDDYKAYYSERLFESSPAFTNRYAGFISEDRLSFETPVGMDEGGIYRVEIEIDNVDSISSLFDGNNPSTDIKVTLTPRYRASNYNPFYDTPFDGEIGGSGRQGYGTSVTGDLWLNENTKANSEGNGLKTVTIQETNSLEELQEGVVLEFDRATNVIKLNPTQPTPVAMSITGTPGNIGVEYKIEGSHANTLLTKDWTLTSSTIGRRKCHDFENNNRTKFTSLKNDSGEHSINWDGIKSGTLTLSSVFFTPKLPQDILKIIPNNEGTSLNGYEYLQSSRNVFLSNFDDSGVTDYDTLKGILQLVYDGKLCVSKNSSEKMEIFWNKEYIERLIREVSPNTGYACQR